MPRAGNCHSGTTIGWPFGVIQRVLGEPGAHVVNQQLVLQRVDPTAGDLGDERGLLGAGSGDGDDRGDDDVDRDDVDGAFGDAGKLRQQTAGITDDHRFGHAEATNPAWPGFGQRRLDDRRAHDADGHVALVLGESLLAKGFGVGVSVGPTQAGGTGPTSFNQFVGDPALTQLLGLACQCWSPGGAEFFDGPARKLRNRCGSRLGSFGVASQTASGGDFFAPVQTKVKRAFADQLFGCVATAVARDVTGADGHQVRGNTQVVEG